MASSSPSSRLAEIMGAANVTSEPAQLAAYRIDGITPAAAVKPGSREEISQVVKCCAAEKLAIVPCGARSKLSMGAPPRRFDVALDMARLDRIVAYDPSDLTLSVEPGIPLQRLAGVLAGHTQFLPLAVPFLGFATAGGTIASGVHSSLRQAYGTARDFLLGVEFVTGDGTAAKSGGSVVKNVAGYDLHKLMIGSMGTLGIITQINFRTFPAPPTTRAFAATFRAAQSAFALCHHVRHSPLRPLTMDVLNPEAVEMLSSARAARIEPGPSPVDRVPKGKWAFLATYSGSGAVQERYERELKQMGEGAGCESHEVFGDEKNPASFGRLGEFVPIALESSPATVIIKLSTLPTKTNEILAAATDALQANQLRCAAMIGGLGVGYVALLLDARDDESRARAQNTAAHILGTCAELGGNATIPWCPAGWKSTLKTWGAERADFDHMRKLKDVFDPAHILAPGRFAGGV